MTTWLQLVVAFCFPAFTALGSVLSVTRDPLSLFVVFMAAGFGGLGGISANKAIKKKNPRTP